MFFLMLGHLYLMEGGKLTPNIDDARVFDLNEYEVWRCANANIKRITCEEARANEDKKRAISTMRKEDQEIIEADSHIDVEAFS